jgi:hypothetical protein
VANAVIPVVVPGSARQPLTGRGICYDEPTMVEVELGCPSENMPQVFEAAATELGLLIKRSSLAKYPGSVHWHLTYPGEKGTLEATWWPSRDRLWLAISDRRRADWQAELVRRLEIQFPATPGSGRTPQK